MVKRIKGNLNSRIANLKENKKPPVKKGVGRPQGSYKNGLPIQVYKKLLARHKIFVEIQNAFLEDTFEFQRKAMTIKRQFKKLGFD